MELGKLRKISLGSLLIALTGYLVWQNYLGENRAILLPTVQPPQGVVPVERPRPDQESHRPMTHNRPEALPQHLTRPRAEYLRWRTQGQQAETGQNWEEAARCYTWALTYWADSELEQHLEQIVQNLAREKKANLQTQADEQQAAQHEQSGHFSEALAIYERLAQLRPAVVLQTKMEDCRYLIKMEQKIGDLHAQAEKYLAQGEWETALAVYEKAVALAEQWPKNKPQSSALTEVVSNVKSRCALLKEALAQITKFLQEGRPAKILQLTTHLAKRLPTKAFVATIRNRLQADMAFIPAGSFIMGSSVEPDEMPQQVGDLPGYYLDRYEVTNRQYRQFIQATGANRPAAWTEEQTPQTYPDHPVSGISWEEARDYALWSGKRLPSEAEWEKAARGVDGRLYPWGNEFRKEFCNCLESNRQSNIQVGSFAQGQSPFGCFDMAGNVLEWTADGYLAYPGNTGAFPARSDYRVARGGSWYYPGTVLRCSNRYPLAQTVRLASIGFRCALDND